MDDNYQCLMSYKCLQTNELVNSEFLLSFSSFSSFQVFNNSARFLWHTKGVVSSSKLQKQGSLCTPAIYILNTQSFTLLQYSSKNKNDVNNEQHKNETKFPVEVCQQIRTQKLPGKSHEDAPL